jgi:short-subunit dehydrogenase
MNAVITGASKGLGKALAEKFAEMGYSLFICSRNDVQLYKTMEELLTKYPQCSVKAKPVDLSNKDKALDFAQWVLQYVNSADILINNAGQFFPGSVYNEADGLLEKMMEVNLYSAYHLTRALLPKMMEVKKGHVFNMCSIASFQAYTNGGAYSISKFALAGFSKNLREEMKPYNIKVTAVYMGAAYTDSWSSSGIDAKRFMKTGDVVEMIYAAALLSSQACVEEILLRPQLGDI